MSQTPQGDEFRPRSGRTRDWKNWWWFVLIAIFLALFVYMGLQARG